MSINLHNMLSFWATRWPQRHAIRCAGRDMTWGELHRRSDEIAAGLHRIGVRHGDRVGILMHNRVEFIESMLGVIKAGGAVTLLNVRFTPREMVYPIVDAGIGVVITEPALADLLSEAEHELPKLRVYAADPIDGCGLLDDLRISGATAPDLQIGSDDVALVCYTSGTTGFPKGAMLTHGNIRESALASNIPSGMTFADRLLVSLPLAYTWASCQYLREAIVTGATATIIEPRSDVDNLIDLLAGEKITAWSSVPVLFERISNSPRFGSVDFSNLRHAVTGGASLHLLRSWQSLGVPITQAYGLTETAGHVTLLFADDAERKLGTTGRPVMNVDLRIVDEQGAVLEAGQTGEISVRGPTVMKGYLNKPEATATVMEAGWLRTGDMGFFDDEGFLKVVDRSKDMLKSGGLNVYPAELERVLAGVPGLEEFAIIGVRDERWGEVPMIVAHGSRPLDVSKLKECCLRELADYKRPKYVLDHGKPLPRTISGKILKRELRHDYPTAPASATSLRD
ncbi:class I adenylate-forming enzyme family protein [Steroidobacter flavus]|uniref:Class I adenylate-forming enzyme family protein n=1 Tax=Steroidobacter flavus TaxID=1842136 RepID=A0ABV8T3W8_9GAMM